MWIISFLGRCELTAIRTRTIVPGRVRDFLFFFHNSQLQSAPNVICALIEIGSNCVGGVCVFCCCWIPKEKCVRVCVCVRLVCVFLLLFVHSL